MRDGEAVVNRLRYLWQCASGSNPSLQQQEEVTRTWNAYHCARELATMPEPHPPRHRCKVCEGSGYAAGGARPTGTGKTITQTSICPRCHGSGFHCPQCNSTDDDVLARNWVKGCCDDGWSCDSSPSYLAGYKPGVITTGCLLCDVWRELRVLAFGQQWVTNTHPGDEA